MVKIKGPDGKDPEDTPKKYSCSSDQCVLDQNGIYTNDKCDGKCKKTDTGDKSTCNHE